MNSAGNEVATPLRRLSSWAIDSALFLPTGAAIFFAVAFLVFAIDDLLWDLPFWGYRTVSILFVVAIYSIVVGGWWIVLILTAMNKWQMMMILVPTIIVTLILSTLFYMITLSYISSAMPVAISSLIAYTIWTLILFSNGQTIGKRLVGIQAVRQNGESVGWGLMFVREILKSLLHLFLIGFIIDGVMLLSDKAERQSIADRIAGTVVVRI